MKNVKWILSLIVLVSTSMTWANSSEWKLDIARSNNKITKIEWIKGNSRVEAIATDYLTSLKKNPVIKSSLEADHSVLIIPRRSKRGLFYGDTLILSPGLKVDTSTGLKSEPMMQTDSFGKKSYALEAGAGGYYFLKEDGGRLLGQFFHKTRPVDQAVEILFKKNASIVSEGVAKIDVTSSGLIVQENNNVITYRFGGVQVNGEFVFSQLTPGNVDIIEGQFAGADLMRLARSGSIKPLVGYEQMINDIVKTIFRREKRNSLVWGRLGIDVNGIIYTLAHMMEQKAIPALEGWRIYEMDWGQFNTGGDVDVSVQKIKTLMNAARLKKVILYFPGIHQLIGLGVDDGNTTHDASSAMMGELKLGRVIAIGSENEDGMALIRSKDDFYSLFREFEIPAPRGNDLFSILRETANQVSKETKVTFSDSLIKKIISLTDRLIPNEVQPKKSIECITDLATEFGPANPDSRDTQSVAMDLYRVKEWISKRTRIPGLNLSAEAREFLKWDNFHAEFNKYIIGHEAGKKAIHKAIVNTITGSANTGSSGRENGVELIFFTGPSGVGKTFAPEALSKMMRNKLGIDWKVKQWAGQQFKDESSVNILFGAPPGYVGYDPRGGLMYRWVMSNPQSIMIFDEMDKMDSSIHQALYKVFDEGVVSDNSTGKDGYFTRGVIFLTSNFGSIPEGDGDNPKSCEYIDDWDRWHIFGLEPKKPEVKGWDERKLKRMVITKLKNSGALSPQVVGRIGEDNIIIFHHFNKSEIKEIGDSQLSILKGKYLDMMDINLVYSNGLSEWLANEAWGPDGGEVFDTGARAILSRVKNQVAFKVGEFALNNPPTSSETWEVRLVNDVSNPGKMTVKIFKR